MSSARKKVAPRFGVIVIPQGLRHKPSVLHHGARVVIFGPVKGDPSRLEVEREGLRYQVKKDRVEVEGPPQGQ